MKRILTLALVAAFVMGVAGFASAKEVQMKAQFTHNLTWIDNNDFDDDNAEDDFSASQRVRVYFDYVASESLNAVLGFEIDTQWGDTDGGALGTDGKNVEVKHAYTNFVVPGTQFSVRAGLQPVAFAGAYGSPIFDDDAAGILVSGDITEQVGLTLGYVRALDGEEVAKSNNIDMFTAIVPVKGEGFAVTPYAIYANVGSDIDTDFFAAKGLVNSFGSALEDDADAFWGGVNFEVSMFAPVTVKGDVIYGSFQAEEESNDRAGWFMDLGVEYAADFGTLGLVGVYGTGDDEDVAEDGSGVMPTLNDSGFGLTSFGFSGAAAGGTDGVLAGGDRYDMWAIGAYLADFSMVENLSHKLIVMYGQGTSDEELAGKGDIFLTDEDSFIEVNFDSTYQIYENLACIVELGYINMDRDDEDAWGDADDDAMKAAFYLQYNF